jgi:hypothetical protein
MLRLFCLLLKWQEKYWRNFVSSLFLEKQYLGLDNLSVWIL